MRGEGNDSTTRRGEYFVKAKLRNKSLARLQEELPLQYMAG